MNKRTLTWEIREVIGVFGLQQWAIKLKIKDNGIYLDAKAGEYKQIWLYLNDNGEWDREGNMATFDSPKLAQKFASKFL